MEGRGQRRKWLLLPGWVRKSISQETPGAEEEGWKGMSKGERGTVICGSQKIAELQII